MNNELERSLQYIKSKTNRKTGFVLPDDYLKDFSDTLITHKNKIISNNNPFQVPQDYFENFDEMLTEKIQKESTTKIKVIPLYKKVLKTIPSIAAACLLIFTIYTYNSSKNNLLFDIDTISQDELDALYENGNFNLDNDALSLAISEYSINFDEEIASALNLNNESVETYLNSIDPNSILDEIP
ncbi:hypothetical protein [Tenacibaculum sp. SG-28]|uniref:hypothetical protein n=1 Tax=Tenacibaculum sp. SG-28 TaxID=754426 RepID=UPI000CF4E24A|nr:hypothetical protein [Tenacibaculum sp. SG-28]PQJ23071.1 hypothetical protein BSU00_02085 [Tenacibaculum sp. SG-28]